MNNKHTSFWYKLLGIGTSIVLTGCTSTAEMIREDRDPLGPYNRAMFTFNDKVDKFLLKPVAQGYQAIMPELLNEGVTNIFSNLNDVVVVFNDLLQAKFHLAVMDTSRFVFNSTFGLAGFFDVATHMDLPKHQEDFGQTLGYWGVGEGYFLVLPLLGPSTTRDVWSVPVDGFILSPVCPGIDRTCIAMRIVQLVDTRAGLLRLERALEDAAVDRYSFQRSAFLQRRRNLVYDGNPPQPEFDFDDNDSDL